MCNYGKLRISHFFSYSLIIYDMRVSDSNRKPGFCCMLIFFNAVILRYFGI